MTKPDICQTAASTSESSAIGMPNSGVARNPRPIPARSCPGPLSGAMDRTVGSVNQRFVDWSSPSSTLNPALGVRSHFQTTPVTMKLMASGNRNTLRKSDSARIRRSMRFARKSPIASEARTKKAVNTTVFRRSSWNRMLLNTAW